eukprot:15291443-Heterocapsa_arctica.AAC.1
MEEDALDRGDTFGEQMTMRNQIAVNNVITLNNFVTPTKDMEMRIRAEELQPEGFAGMLPTQDSSLPQWKAELDHLQQQRVLQMQFLAESSGELRDRQPQSGDDQCHWKM